MFRTPHTPAAYPGHESQLYPEKQFPKEELSLPHGQPLCRSAQDLSLALLVFTVFYPQCLLCCPLLMFIDCEWAQVCRTLQVGSSRRRWVWLSLFFAALILLLFSLQAGSCWLKLSLWSLPPGLALMKPGDPAHQGCSPKVPQLQAYHNNSCFTFSIEHCNLHRKTLATSAGSFK